MTVEQSALPQRCSQKRSREEIARAYAQIKYITGVEDEHVISEAIDACKDKNGKYEISNVVDMLVTDGSVCKSPPRRQKTSESKQQEEEVTVQEEAIPLTYPKTGKSPAGVIDLTSEQTDGDELQKAIAASLQDTQGILGGQVTREEQDISRVLEQSLAESKAGTKRKRGEIWFVDPLNPHERKREVNWPVGLKNVGNTCWFSAVIQSCTGINIEIVKQSADMDSARVAVTAKTISSLEKLLRIFINGKRKDTDFEAVWYDNRANTAVGLYIISECLLLIAMAWSIMFT